MYIYSIKKNQWIKLIPYPKDAIIMGHTSSFNKKIRKIYIHSMYQLSRYKYYQNVSCGNTPIPPLKFENTIKICIFLIHQYLIIITINALLIEFALYGMGMIRYLFIYKSQLKTHSLCFFDKSLRIKISHLLMF